MKIKSIFKVSDLVGKKVLLRADFNVPIKDGKILDDYKILKQLDTIKYLVKNEARVIILTHLGRPEGKKTKVDSTKPIAKALQDKLRMTIQYVDDVCDFKAGTGATNLKNGEIMLLENVRFEKGEKKNDKKFAKKLADLADIYVNDAFGVCHRAHASVSAIKSYIPSYAGILLEQEILNLNKALKPEKPLVLIIGGKKVATKAELVKKFSKIADHILIGGALANNFLKAKDLEVGKSLIDEESVELARKLRTDKIVYPIDVVVSQSKNGGVGIDRNVEAVLEDDYIFDIGPKTIGLYSTIIKEAKTVVWNGPLGFFELKEYRNGTSALAQLIAGKSKEKLFGIIGGGETVEALRQTKMLEYVDWVSTGGGAMLTYLGGGDMPGLKGII